jgi:hypothetical protein
MRYIRAAAACAAIDAMRCARRAAAAGGHYNNRIRCMVGSRAWVSKVCVCVCFSSRLRRISANLRPFPT